MHFAAKRMKRCIGSNAPMRRETLVSPISREICRSKNIESDPRYKTFLRKMKLLPE